MLAWRLTRHSNDTRHSMTRDPRHVSTKLVIVFSSICQPSNKENSENWPVHSLDRTELKLSPPVLSELFLLIVLEQNRSLSIWIVYDHVTERYLTLRGLEKRREPGSENWTVMLPVDTLQRNSTAISGKFKTRQATTTFVHVQHEDVLSLRARNCNDPHTRLSIKNNVQLTMQSMISVMLMTLYISPYCISLIAC